MALLPGSKHKSTPGWLIRSLAIANDYEKLGMLYEISILLHTNLSHIGIDYLMNKQRRQDAKFWPCLVTKSKRHLGRVSIAIKIVAHCHSCGLVWELNESLISVWAHIKFWLHQTPKRLCQFTKLLMRCLIRQISDVENLQTETWCVCIPSGLAIRNTLIPM